MELAPLIGARMFNGLADVIEKHPKAIVAFWVVMLLAAAPFALESDKNLSYDITSMEGAGSESMEGMDLIYDSGYFYNSSSEMSTILVVEFDDHADESKIPQFQSSLAKQMEAEYGSGASVVYTGRFSDGITNDSGICMYLVNFDNGIDPKDEVSTLRGLASNANPGGLTTFVTGQSAIAHDTEAGASEDISKIDPFSILLVLILIGLFFRSIVSSATPPIVIGFAYGVLLCLAFFLSNVMGIYYITTIIVLVSMLGAGCDYCIFIISRYREERKRGLPKESALRESIIWAGESITTSGCSVIIGFGVMSFSSFSMISTMGMVLAAGIVLALLAALTLIPAIIMLVGDRIFYPSKIADYQDGSKALGGMYGKVARFGQRYFISSAKFSIKHAWGIIIACILITAPLAYVTLTHESSYDMISTMPRGEAKDGVNAIVENTDGGIIMPTYVLVAYNEPIASISTTAIGNVTVHLLVWSAGASDCLNATDSLAGAIATEEDDVAMAYGPTSWARLVYLYGNESAALQALPSESLKSAVSNVMTSSTPEPYRMMYIDYIINYLGGTLGGQADTVTGVVSCNYAKVTVIVRDEPMSPASMDTIKNLRGIVDDFDAANEQTVSQTWLAGSAVTLLSISETVNAEFVWIEIGVIVLIYLLLFVVLKSFITPLRSIVTIVMSVIWTLGLTFLLFDGLLDIPVTWIIPIVLFVVCLGLGMDYDIFLTTRIRENVKKCMTNDQAICHAMERSGAVITICGLIMAGAFSTLMISTAPMLQEFGFALGFAILVDALFVRTYVVPAVMHLLGRWNWYGPKSFSDR
jgi:RND superfamily putative drug exporter